MKGKLWIGFLFFFLFAFSFYSFAMISNLEKIPGKDRKILEDFFHILLHDSTFGYALCGEKPVAIETFPSLSKLPFKYAARLVLFHYKEYAIQWKGREIWNRYDSLFPSKNFVLRFIPAYDTLVLVNKKAAREVIEENIDLFHQLSPGCGSVEKILQDVCEAKDQEYVVGHHQALLGILLGYGKNNALAFSNPEERAKLVPFQLFDDLKEDDGFIDPGLMVLEDALNAEENARIRMQFLEAKMNLIKQCHQASALEVFLRLYTRESGDH